MPEPQHIGSPLEAALASLVEQAVARALADFRTALQPAPQLDLAACGLEPLKVYDAKQVADILGIKRVASVYEIPEDELPRVRRIGSTIGFLGINVLAYMHGLEPVDMQAVVEEYRERLLSERPNVRPLHPNENGKTRVL